MDDNSACVHVRCSSGGNELGHAQRGEEEGNNGHDALAKHEARREHQHVQLVGSRVVSAPKILEQGARKTRDGPVCSHVHADTKGNARG
eukprot:1511353-Pleurochrysis_carterae.AAC.2